MSQRVRASDLFLALAGAAGLVAFVLLYRTATPQAAVRLEIARPDALTRAGEFLQARGASVAEWKGAAVFAGDTESLVFLQRTLGLSEASRWAREEVPVWRWSHRWFRPEVKEEW